ncbi:MAG TPA: PIG-L family deacetylase [Spirochaetota bacterium]|nr:PIG-L family deacetylase [Spirochaetota bacterium]HPU88657.1 PIG-L family deacetylase [Spirochaetota bacterium]
MKNLRAKCFMFGCVILCIIVAAVAFSDDFSSQPQKALIMAIVAHPDDEPSALLACYGGGLGLPVIWVQMTSGDAWCGGKIPAGPKCGAVREKESLDAARNYGMKNPPIFGRYVDCCGWKKDRLAENLERWGGKEKALAFVVGLIRKHRPEVVWTHNVDGEYRHNNHIACSLITREAVLAAADPSRFRDLPEANDPWKVKKLYLYNHGWNKWYKMDAILPGLGGRSVAKAAADGYHCHVTQGKDKETPGSGVRGGLWSSSVGPDVAGDDILENLDLARWKPRTIYGTVSLPAGQVAPEGGIRLTMWIVDETNKSWRRFAHIPAGKNGTWFHLLYGMDTGKSYRVGVQRDLPGQKKKLFWHRDGMKPEKEADRVTLEKDGAKIDLVAPE